MTVQRSLLTPTRFLAVASAAALAVTAANAVEEDGMQLQNNAEQMLDQCEAISESCAEATQDAEAVLVFPEVLKADLIVGGAGGNGVLMMDGEPVGYYDVGKASVGLQAGIDEFAMVYVFKSEDALADLTDGDEWEAQASTGLTLITANADASTTTGDPAVYVFDADGLNAEVDLAALRIWEDPENAY